MFHVMRNKPFLETQLIDSIIGDIRGRLPPLWSLCNREMDKVYQGSGQGSLVIDAILELRDPQGLTVPVVVEVKSFSLETQFVNYIAQTLSSYTSSLSTEEGESGVAVLGEAGTDAIGHG